jgi:hypothetical protein
MGGQRLAMRRPRVHAVDDRGDRAGEVGLASYGARRGCATPSTPPTSRVHRPRPASVLRKVPPTLTALTPDLVHSSWQYDNTPVIGAERAG